MLNRVKLISLNIERSKHLGLVLPFLEKEQPDIVCLQEVFEHDLPQIKQLLNAEVCFSPRVTYKTEPGLEGIAIFSRLPIKSFKIDNYDPATELPTRYGHTWSTRPKTTLLSTEIDWRGRIVHVATTHFVLSEKAQITEEQRVAANNLHKLVDQFPDLILCGDFNTPRGGEIYNSLAAKLTDNLPVDLTTTIDGAIHRSGPLPYVVDGLFTTAHYGLTSIEVRSGVSDHCALIATIERINSD